MINVYFNYPNSNISIHQTRDCPKIQMHHSPNQRVLKLNIITFQEIMQKFIDGDFEFRTEQGFSDLWLEINFGELAFEIAIVNYIIFNLGRRYAPFDSLNPNIHC